MDVPDEAIIFAVKAHSGAVFLGAALSFMRFVAPRAYRKKKISFLG